MKMPFGKFQDVEIAKVPKPYLLWLQRQPWLSKWLVKAIDEVLCGMTKVRSDCRTPDTSMESDERAML